LELKRRVRLSGETDCVTAPFRSVPRSPNDPAFSHSIADSLFSLPNRSFVIEEGGKMQALCPSRGLKRSA
jgi:hypothetical protein